MWRLETYVGKERCVCLILLGPEDFCGAGGKSITLTLCRRLCVAYPPAPLLLYLLSVPVVPAMAAGGLRSILSRTGSVRLAGCCHSLLSTPCAGAPQKRYWHQGTARFCVSRIFEKHMSNTRRPCQAEPALQGRAGAVRGLAQDDGSFKTAGGGIRASPFEEDCRVVEECSSLVNARLDIPG